MISRISVRLMLALLFLLQGSAPFVHAHAAGDRDAGVGLHLHGLPHATDGAHSQLESSDTLAVSVASTIKKKDDPLIVASSAALRTLPFTMYEEPASAAPVPALSSASRRTPRLLPLKHAPPPNSAQ
jgi:hypothetical protein